MTANVGTLDRVLRALPGLGLLYGAFFSGSPFFETPVPIYGAAAIGIAMLGVAALRSCPVHSFFGLKTCRS